MAVPFQLFEDRQGHLGRHPEDSRASSAGGAPAQAGAGAPQRGEHQASAQGGKTLHSARHWRPAFDGETIALFQPLHGVTFALLHLACIRVLAICVPPQLAATAQALYGTVGVGAATAILIVVSGWLYSSLGAYAFLVMSGLCLAALPVAFSLPAVRSAAGSG
jgi:MFS_1 like family